MSQWKFADSSDSEKQPDTSPASSSPLEATPESAKSDTTNAATTTPAVAAPSPPASSAGAPFQFLPSDEPAAPPPPAKKAVASQPPKPQVPAPAAPAPTAPAAQTPIPTAPAPATPPMMAQAGGAMPPVPASGAMPQNPTAPRVPSPTPPPRHPAPPSSGVPKVNVPGAAPQAQAAAASPAVPSPVAPTVPSPNAPTPGVPSPAMPPGAARSSAQAPAVPSPAAPTATSAPAAPVPSPTYGAVPQVATPKVKSVQDEKVSAWQGREVLEKLEPVAKGLFGICMTLFLFALLYVGFGLISSGKLIADATPPQTPTTVQTDPTAVAAQQAAATALQQAKGQVATLVNNGHTAAMVLSWALVGISLSLVVLAFDLGAIGAVVAGLGALLLFLSPPGIFGMFGKNLITNSIIQGLIAPPPLMMVIGVGMLKLLADVFIFFASIPERMRTKASVGVPQPADAKQRLAAANANMLSPCWELPFCREVVKKQCPAFLAKKRCWKFGRGCYCDEEMISRIIRGESLEVIKSPTRMSRQGKPPCGKCHIYLEHQRHKFRWLSPLSIPGTAAAMFFGWPVYLAFFDKFWLGVSPLFAAVSFDPKGMSEKMGFEQNGNDFNYNQISPEQMKHITSNGLAIIIGFLALIYISKAVEWVVYKLQW